MAVNLLDLIYPYYCLGCNQEGELLCKDCLEKLIIKPQKNKSAGNLNNLWVLSKYQDYLIADLIHKLKYEYLTGVVGLVWSKYLNKFWEQFGSEIISSAIIVPMPLHRRRYLSRGYNQSELIAQELAKISGLVIDNRLLRRVIYHEPQVGLSGQARTDNVKGVFKVDYYEISQTWGKEIILIDDVYTTGSTMAEATKTLNSAGFNKVSGLVLAVD